MVRLYFYLRCRMLEASSSHDKSERGERKCLSSPGIVWVHVVKICVSFAVFSVMTWKKTKSINVQCITTHFFFSEGVAW